MSLITQVLLATATWASIVIASDALPPWFVQDPGHCVLAHAKPAEEPQNAIPQPAVTRQTYLAWCARSGHLERDLKSRDHGPYGPRHALPSLAKFVASGDRRYGESVKEVLRVNGKTGAAQYLKNLDPASDKAHICCGLIVTEKELPFKLVFRNGWQPGDLFMLVDLFPRHEPMNPTGILGLTRYGVPFTQTVTSKNVTDFHNMLMVEDLSGTATPVINPNPHTIDAYYQDVSVERLSDHQLATHAVVKVKDYTGFPMTLTREFFFVKNRFVVVKDVAEFRERFVARVGPTWKTQRISAAGEHWLNTYMASPLAAENIRLNSLAYDLLICHAPKEGARVEVVETAKPDEKYAYVPLRTRHAWQGIVEPGKKLSFTQLLVPHSPLKPAADLADGVEFLLSSPEQTVLRVSLGEDHQEYVLLNAAAEEAGVGGERTDGKAAYFEVRKGQATRALFVDGTHLTHASKPICRLPRRGDWEKPAP